MLSDKQVTLLGLQKLKNDHFQKLEKQSKIMSIGKLKEFKVNNETVESVGRYNILGSRINKVDWYTEEFHRKMGGKPHCGLDKLMKVNSVLFPPTMYR